MDYDSLTNDELRAELTRNNISVCPITKFTKPLLIRKLKNLGTESNGTASAKVQEQVTKGLTTPIKEKWEESQQDASDSFYGINSGGTESKSLVVRNLKDAVSLVKSSPGARFKAFKLLEDAEMFSVSSIASPSVNMTAVVNAERDPLSKFPSIPTREFTKMKRLIEDNFFEELLELINSNPKYLLTSYDTPTLIHEGFRRNALHVASSNGRPAVVEALLSLLKDIYFLAKVYDFEDPHDGSALEKSQRLLECYLNTPEKGSCDTPLHLACAYGFFDVANILYREPLTKRHAKNKHGITPYGSICTRTLKGLESSREYDLQALFQNDCLVVITSLHGRLHAQCTQENIESLQGMMAVLGPLTSTSGRQVVNHINRGIEHHDFNFYLRSTAKKFACNYIENFQFMGAFVDFGTEIGCALLEKFLTITREKMEQERRYFGGSVCRRLFGEPSDYEDELSTALSRLNISDVSVNSQRSVATSSNVVELPVHSLFRAKWGDSLLDSYLRSVFQSYPIDSSRYPALHYHILSIKPDGD